MSFRKKSKKKQFNDKLAFFDFFVSFLNFGSIVFKRFGNGTPKASNAPHYRESPNLFAGPWNKSCPGEDVQTITYHCWETCLGNLVGKLDNTKIQILINKVFQPSKLSSNSWLNEIIYRRCCSYVVVISFSGHTE